MSGPVDLFMVYQFIKRLSTPFAEWDAYKLGIIDEDGQVLKKKLRTVKERAAYGYFDRMIRNIKLMLNKVPGGNTRLGSYAAALWLIKEGETFNNEILTEEVVEERLNTYMEQASRMLNEEVPVNNVGGGAIAGTSADSEPGVKRKQQRKYKMKNHAQVRVPKGIYVEGV